MDHPQFFFMAILWMVIWGAVGAVMIRRAYFARDLDVTQARAVGVAVGAATGPFGLIPLYLKTPELTRRWRVLPWLGVAAVFTAAFALSDPDNVCVTSGSFVASQVTNGLIIGTIYGLMALGLALIFSIIGIVSFSHGEFYMIGGMVVYYMTEVWLPGAGPVLAVIFACVVTFMIGALFERAFLTPIYDGRVERPNEYAILVTFGLAFFLQYLVQGLSGANPVKARPFFELPKTNIPEDGSILATTRSNITLFDTISVSTPRLTAAVISVLMLGLLIWFLYKTWWGKGLRAVAQDRQAAAVAGINPKVMNMVAFGLGCMLAGLAGAVLVQAFSWLPQTGMIPALRAFVIIVLGGLGSLPGAFIGGLLLGLIEATGVGCMPDPTRAAAYLPAYGMIVLTLVLLLKPTGLFGKKI
ncbi:branched-chain amino acid ABC transporter permease [Tabrizicola sp.]|uniref:branched-chain amino acid ABC transporter permease n=1 Tax=Tabrizicola sp. TaxID=2005166 RepID=UPI00261B7FBF|nr:branched-chain amino acid ABC transporter permease [Tabrizicola sp.]MDM7933641.1 branched-chain amino acid ABC transporter permease [Tabrizicola sp.]